MPIPGQSLSIRDPGLGLVEPASNVFVLFGTSSIGTPNVVQALGSPGAVVDAFGEGPLAEGLAHVLEVAGGPVYGVKLPSVVAGTAGAVTKAAAGTSTGTAALGGTPFGEYEVIVEITRTGTLGTAEFRYTLDGGRTYSESRVVPSGGSFAIPKTGVTLTFTAGAGPVYLERGDTFTAATVAPYYSVTEVGAAFDALGTYLSSAPTFDPDAVILLGRHPSGTAAATLFAVLGSRLSALEQSFRFVGGMMDAGSADTRANVKTALAAVADSRVLVVYGDAVLASGKPYAGYGSPKLPALVAVAARAADSLPSTSLGRVADGPLTGVSAITHDEYVTEELDAAKITTLRSYPGRAGFYITDGRMKSSVGSDFRSWQYRRVMDLACRTVVRAQSQFVLSELLVNPDGTIQEAEARRIEEVVKDQLRAVLIDPKNASGRRGHVTAFEYTVDRVANIVSTSFVPTSVAIQPLGYAERIKTDIGFAKNLGA
jgi:hypothetical protein